MAHIMVEALAGTGKTTTLIEGITRLLSPRSANKKIKPSPQQAAVWDCLKKYPRRSTARFVAFNKSIAEELQDRVPPGCSASTMHSLGFAALRDNSTSRLKVTTYRTTNLIQKITGKDWRELRKKDFELLNATEALVGLCKQTLTDPSSSESLEKLVSHYGIETNGKSVEIFSLVEKVYQESKQVDREIDYNDMIWLPVVLDLPIPKFDILLVDEAQDLNRCQQSLALKAGKHLVLCGDRNQAIYGFAGADTESIPRMIDKLDSLGGCTVLPLTVTYRCGKAIVEHAKQIVSEFEAHATCPAGLVDNLSPEKLLETVKPLDMVLCRVNAPLVRTCFQLIKNGVRADIRGRDIGKGLINLVNKQKAVDVGDLIGKIDDWYHEECQKEARKKNPDDAKLIALEDKKACIDVFSEGATTIAEVVGNIERMFSDKDSSGVQLSSIHRAKGLEASHVYLLEPGLLPHPMAKNDWQREQEKNLDWVARTRAINTLTYLRG